MNRTEQEKEFIYLLGQLREKGQPGDYIAVILAVEALAAGQPGIVIDKHHPRHPAQTWKRQSRCYNPAE